MQLVWDLAEFCWIHPSQQGNTSSLCLFPSTQLHLIIKKMIHDLWWNGTIILLFGFAVRVFVCTVCPGSPPALTNRLAPNMKFEDRSGKHLRLLVPVVMATNKGYFYGQNRIAVGYNIAYDVMAAVTSPMMSCDVTLAVMSRWQWCHGNTISRHLDA